MPPPPVDDRYEKLRRQLDAQRFVLNLANLLLGIGFFAFLLNVPVVCLPCLILAICLYLVWAVMPPWINALDPD